MYKMATWGQLNPILQLQAVWKRNGHHRAISQWCIMLSVALRLFQVTAAQF